MMKVILKKKIYKRQKEYLKYSNNNYYLFQVFISTSNKKCPPTPL